MTKILINSSKIKYDILKGLFENVDINKYDKINFMIDAHDIFYRLYVNEFSADIMHQNREDVVVDMVTSFLNVVAHYRRYMTTKLKKSNKIFISFNRKTPSYQSSLIEYGTKFYDRYSKHNKEYSSLNSIIDEAVDFIKETCQYFEGIYFIDAPKIDDSTVFGSILSESTGNDLNIIFSRNEMMLQLINKHTMVLYPKRDSSLLLTRDNCFDRLLSDRQYKPRHINYNHVAFFTSLHGLKCRDVDSPYIKGAVKIMKLMDKMIECEEISGNVSMKSFIEALKKYVKIYDVDETILMNIYRAINVNLSVKSLTKPEEKLIKSCIIDLYDQKGLESLNNMMDNEDRVINISDLNSNKVRKKSIWDF